MFSNNKKSTLYPCKPSYVCSYYFCSVWVAAGVAAFEKELFTRLTICSLCILSVCNFSNCPFLVRVLDLVSVYFSSGVCMCVCFYYKMGF